MSGAESAIGAVIALAGTAISTYSAVQSAEAQSDAAKYNQKVAQNEAEARRYAAETEADNRREQYRRILAAQRTRIGASGVDASEGSPLLVQMESAAQAELDLSRVRWAGEAGARASQSEGILQGYYARQSRRMGYINAGATLLQGVGSAYNASQRTTKRPAAGSSMMPVDSDW